MKSKPPIGVLLVDKPTGVTSHDIVDVVRKNTGVRRVGHTGTLDPNATGLLVILIGRKATREQQRFLESDKIYEGTMLLGQATTTQDAEGEVTGGSSPDHLTPEQIEAVLRTFTGEIQQIPPMTSAIKHRGEPLYAYARRGQEIKRDPRKVTVYKLDILSIELPRVRFRITCSKGTYVRTLCHDAGEKLGCGAHLSELRRLEAGPFQVTNAYTVEQIEAASLDEIRTWLIPIDEAVRVAKG